jgi:hypothetical protein
MDRVGVGVELQGVYTRERSDPAPVDWYLLNGIVLLWSKHAPAVTL